MVDIARKRLDDYRLIQLLGSGAFGQVYLGEHIYKKTQVAIKVLQQISIEDLANFINEARIIKLEHPHIVQVLDFGLDGLTPFIVMQLASGGSLREKHHRGTQLSTEVVISYTKQIAEALQYAHGERLIHRDIKPENMLLGSKDEILLSDFGIAAISRNTSSLVTLNIAGTIAYMAPEQIEGKPCFASDQYALGIVVYEWLVGNLPFSGSPLEIATQHLLTPPPSLRGKIPDLPSETEQVVMKALSKNPKQRFASIQDFAYALERSLLGSQEITFCTFTKHKNKPTRIKWSPDSNYISSLSKEIIYVWKAQTGKVVFTWETSEIYEFDVYTERSIEEIDFHWSHNSKYIAVCSKKFINIWNVSTGQKVFAYDKQFEDIPTCVWSPNDNYFAFYHEGMIQIWNILNNSRTFFHEERYERIASVKWLGNDLQLILSKDVSDYYKSDKIYIYYLNSQISVICDDDDLWGMYGSPIVSPDGKFVASALTGFTGNLDDGYEPTCNGLIVWNAKNGHVMFSKYCDCDIEDFLMEFSPDSKYIAFSKEIIDIDNGNSIIKHHEHTISWSPNAKSIVLTTTNLELWDIATGKIKFNYCDHFVWIEEIQESIGTVGIITWSPDEKFIAIEGIFNGKSGISVIDADSGTNRFVYSDHSTSVEIIEWAPNGKFIASASIDGVIKIWLAPKNS